MTKINFVDDIFEDSNEFFGFKYNKENQLKFLLPKFIIPQGELTHLDSFKLLGLYSGVVKKYYVKNKHIEHVSSNTQFYEKNNKIYGYISLILDYLENDDFILFEHFYKKGNNKIDWQKTLNSKDLIIQDNKIVYNSFVSKNTKHANSDDFYKIYIYTFSLAWKMFFNQNFFENEISINFSVNHIMSIINQFIDEHFKDREIHIAHILKAIYSSHDISLEGKLSIEGEYCTEIQDIWESMIESIIPKKYKYEREQVQGKYRRIQDGFEIKGLATEIDHCIKMEKQKRIFILDSKFYSTYHNFNSKKQPKSESINKQETYKKLMELENVGYKVSNFFILPKNNINKTKPEYFCDHVLKRKKIDDNFLIHCVALDFQKVCECYSKNIQYRDFMNLLNDYKTYFNLYNKNFSIDMFVNLLVYEKIKPEEIYDKKQIAKMFMFLYENLAKRGIRQIEFEVSSKLSLKIKEVQKFLKPYGWTYKIAKKETKSYYKFSKI